MQPSQVDRKQIEVALAVFELGYNLPMVLVDAVELSKLQRPPFPPSLPTLIFRIDSRQVLSAVKRVLATTYPEEHPLKLLGAPGTPRQGVEELALSEIDRCHAANGAGILYLPALPTQTAFESFQEVVARLRAPGGCPWDREQTHLSLRQHLMEEAYETLTALDSQDAGSLKEELGDLLLQIVLHAQIASEAGEFSVTDVIEGIHNKIVRRHPHVFGKTTVSCVSGVLVNWEKIKEAERSQHNQHQAKGLLDGVPRAFPALAQAQELQERAARVGFDWDSIEPVIAKVKEELEEVFSATQQAELEAELGDLLFAVVNLMRWYKVDAESALRLTIHTFRERFAYIEEQAQRSGKRLTDMNLAEMDALWNEAKNQRKADGGVENGDSG